MNNPLKNLGQLKDAAATVQGFTVALAIIIGGLWTLVVFGMRDLPRLERELREQANVQFKFHVEPVSNLDGRSQLISIRVDAMNTGNRATVLEFREPPLRIRAIRSEGDGIQFSPAIKASPLTYVSNPERQTYRRSRLRASGSQSYYFVVRLPERGAYWITMSVPLTEKESAEWPTDDAAMLSSVKTEGAGRDGPVGSGSVGAQEVARRIEKMEETDAKQEISQRRTKRRWSGGTLYMTNSVPGSP